MEEGQLLKMASEVDLHWEAGISFWKTSRR